MDNHPLLQRKLSRPILTVANPKQKGRQNMNTYDPTADNALDQSGWEEPAPNKAQHSPLPDEAEITRQAGLQAARSHKWNGWDWKAYQTSITRQNHHISKVEAHADKLAGRCKEAIERIRLIHGKTDSDNQYLGIVQRILKEEVAAYEAAQ